ncbi:MAG: DUF1772 domain-containing protein [Vicinamibacterales bacterium]
MILLLVVATAAAGFFAGAAIYINAVEHPARMSGGVALALKEFGPSYRRATVMQVSLAVTGLLSGVLYGWESGDRTVLVAALLLGAVIPFTLVAIMPTNRRLLAAGLENNEVAARALLTRWNRLHGVRSLLSAMAFVGLLSRLAGLD